VTFKTAADFLVGHLESVFAGDFEEVVGEALALLASAPKIFVYGVGRSGLVGKAFAMRMVQLGLRVFFIGETITPIVEPGDVVVIVSRTGETMSAIQTANIVRRVGGHVIAVTADRGSKLAKASSLVVTIEEPRDREAARHAPLGTLFEESTFLFLDVLVGLLMEKLGQTEEDMRGRHAIMV
jgi:6-phospho-3-hexuloisomerase